MILNVVLVLLFLLLLRLLNTLPHSYLFLVLVKVKPNVLVAHVKL